MDGTRRRNRFKYHQLGIYAEHKESTHEVISSHSGRRKPTDGVRNAGQVFNNPEYKTIYLK